MSRLALLCSGQGFQHARMFALTAEAEAAEPVFAAATDILGTDPRAVARADEPAALHDNATAQVLCCTQALAAAEILADALGDREVVVAGYSVGELAAWGVAGVFDPAATLRLAARRAACMDAAATDAPGGLAAVRGLPRAALEAICREHRTHVAIRNGADQFVLGGGREALDATLRAAEKAGAGRVTPLAVGIASHTPLLAAAVDPLREALAGERAHPLSPDRRLLSGLDGTAVFDLDAGRDKLARQVAEVVDWDAVMDACRSADVTRALELGPGHALARLMADRIGETRSRSLEDFRTLDGVMRWLARG